ncbi:hypothetical protein FJY71_00765 [candidate division WOR-3 bacterium]|nr:hypothetical protein [candidate division WOR-3 bacterium]
MRTAGTACLLALSFLLPGCPGPDRTAPEVLDASPRDGATGVVRSRPVTVYFSESMDRGATEQSFGISPTVAGTLGWQNSTVLEFSPSSVLDSSTTYEVAVSTGARDEAGNALAQECRFSFTTGTRVTSQDILMLGRSVLEGWFGHWGWSGDDCVPVVRGRFDLYHRYVESPEPADAMLAGVRLVCESLPPNAEPVVFFKLCFVDFAGGSQAAAESNYARNRAIVDSVLAIVVRGRNCRLILGNALPRTTGETDYWLQWNHAQYNDYLLSLAAGHAHMVFVFELYSVLTDPNTHAIRTAYAAGPGDAHPNEAGYSALDPPWFHLLETNF